MLAVPDTVATIPGPMVSSAVSFKMHDIMQGMRVGAGRVPDGQLRGRGTDGGWPLPGFHPLATVSAWPLSPGRGLPISQCVPSRPVFDRRQEQDRFLWVRPPGAFLPGLTVSARASRFTRGHLADVVRHDGTDVCAGRDPLNEGPVMHQPWN
ncbi:hypothetical protein SAMN05519105_4080 [Rhodobacter sp. 24-YEA-8]|nr:hypothetical protein SAMN05519105_4080 [Rhodobacter sp. 24-YEA-8]